MTTMPRPKGQPQYVEVGGVRFRLAGEMRDEEFVRYADEPDSEVTKGRSPAEAEGESRPFCRGG
jgi:hypothetical protein